jgi:hypothetical protein
MISRRTLAFALAAGAIAVLMPRLPLAENRPAARNIVLVHGLFADGSSWSEVIARLQAAGLNVTSVQNALTTLDEAVKMLLVCQPPNSWLRNPPRLIRLLPFPNGNS